MEEYKGLLGEINLREEMALEHGENKRVRTQPYGRLALGHFWNHAILFYLIGIHILLAAMYWHIRKARGVELINASSSIEPFSPANEGIRTSIQKFPIIDHTHPTRYAGPPNDKNKEAWDSLILPMYFSMNESTMRQTGEKTENSIRLDSGDYVAATAVYHELHCIRQLRLYLYKEVHYPNLLTNQDEYLRGHMDHCLEVLRDRAMCSGDTSIITFFWQDPPGPKPGKKSTSKRKCIVWEKFEKWSLEHMIQADDSVQSGSVPFYSVNRSSIGHQRLPNL